MNTDRLSILIIDDSEVIRLGIAAAMQKESAFDVIGSSALAESIAEKISELKPDVVLIETSSPEIDGIELMRSIREEQPDIKFLVLSMDEEEQSIRRAFDAGADGYCTKGVRMDFLIGGIKSIAGGGRWASPKVVDLLLNATKIVQSEARFVAKQKSHNGTLSTREQQVLNLLVQGYSNTEIGNRLFLSPETIKTHVRHIMEKLSVRDRTHAAVEAVRRGLVTQTAAS